jgi:hypothetical protein
MCLGKSRWVQVCFWNYADCYLWVFHFGSRKRPIIFLKIMFFALDHWMTSPSTTSTLSTISKFYLRPILFSRARATLAGISLIYWNYSISAVVYCWLGTNLLQYTFWHYWTTVDGCLLPYCPPTVPLAFVKLIANTVDGVTTAVEPPYAYGR